MDILLDEDEIREVEKGWFDAPHKGGDEPERLIAKAQLKKIVGWISKDCEEHDHDGEYMWRRRCWDCFEALKKEAGI